MMTLNQFENQYHLNEMRKQEARRQACREFFKLFERHYDIKVSNEESPHRLTRIKSAWIYELPIFEIVLIEEVVGVGGEGLDVESTAIGVVMEQTDPMEFGHKTLEATHPEMLMSRCPEFADLVKRLKEKEEMTEELGQEATSTKSKIRL